MKQSDITDEEIYKAIEKYNSVPFNGKFTPDYLPYPEKVVLAKMEQMVEQGKLDYGISLRTAWKV